MKVLRWLQSQDLLDIIVVGIAYGLYLTPVSLLLLGLKAVAISMGVTLLAIGIVKFIKHENAEWKQLQEDHRTLRRIARQWYRNGDLAPRR